MSAVLASYVKMSTRKKRVYCPWTPEEARGRITQASIPEPNSGCWLWLGALDTDGYGRGRYQQREIKAHRLSYIVHCGEVPDGLLVMHECDTRCCVNPRHLRPGTALENTAQMIARGRSNPSRGRTHYTALKGPVNSGTKNPRALLTEQDVLSIRAAAGTNAEIARRFGCTEGNIQRIRSRTSWRHL